MSCKLVLRQNAIRVKIGLIPHLGGQIIAVMEATELWHG
jgi:hypothetical protein